MTSSTRPEGRRSPTADDIDNLLLSARYGDLDDVRTAVEQVFGGGGDGGDGLAAAVNEGGNGPLHMAAANGHADVVSYLLPHLSLPSLLLKNASGNTALHWAAVNGHLAVVRAIVDRVDQLSPASPASPEGARGEGDKSKTKDENEEKEKDEEGEEDEEASRRRPWDVPNAAGRGPMSEAQMAEKEEVVRFLLDRMAAGGEGSGADAERRREREGEREADGAGALADGVEKLKVDG